MPHLCHGLVTLSRVLALSITTVHPLQQHSHSLGSAMGHFMEQDFYKKHAQHEGGSSCRLAPHTPLQFPAYGGWLKKKIDLNSVKIYSSCITQNKLFLFGHMLCVVLAAPAYASMKGCFSLEGWTGQPSVLIFCMTQDIDVHSITFVWSIMMVLVPLK